MKGLPPSYEALSAVARGCMCGRALKIEKCVRRVHWPHGKPQADFRSTESTAIEDLLDTSHQPVRRATYRKAKRRIRKRSGEFGLFPCIRVQIWNPQLAEKSPLRYRLQSNQAFRRWLPRAVIRNLKLVVHPSP
jgi:hypothetical protein